MNFALARKTKFLAIRNCAVTKNKNRSELLSSRRTSCSAHYIDFEHCCSSRPPTTLCPSVEDPQPTWYRSPHKVTCLSDPVLHPRHVVSSLRVLTCSNSFLRSIMTLTSPSSPRRDRRLIIAYKRQRHHHSHTISFFSLPRASKAKTLTYPFHDLTPLCKNDVQRSLSFCLVRLCRCYDIESSFCCRVI